MTSFVGNILIPTFIYAFWLSFNYDLYAAKVSKYNKIVLLVLVSLLLVGLDVVILAGVAMLVVGVVSVDVRNGGGGSGVAAGAAGGDAAAGVVAGEGSVNRQEDPIQIHHLWQELRHISRIFFVARNWKELKSHPYKVLNGNMIQKFSESFAGWV